MALKRKLKHQLRVRMRGAGFEPGHAWAKEHTTDGFRHYLSWAFG